MESVTQTFVPADKQMSDVLFATKRMLLKVKGH